MPGYRATPAHIREAIGQWTSPEFAIGAVVRCSVEDVVAGSYEHLGVSVVDGGVVAEPSFVPGESCGRWSRYNLFGREIVRRDLPKISKVISSWEVPNFGDWSKGSHIHYATREVFQREVLYGQALACEVTIERDGDRVKIAVRVEQVFARESYSEHDLLLACSLVKENTNRQAQLLPAAEPLEQWLSQQTIDWEILPVGVAGSRTVDSLIERVKGHVSPNRLKVLEERAKAIVALGPTEAIVGSTGFARYVGYKFRQDLVAFENINYGNALYLMYGEWEELSTRSRVDLFRDTSARYDRIVHRGEWSDRARRILAAHGHPPLSEG